MTSNHSYQHVVSKPLNESAHVKYRSLHLLSFFSNYHIQVDKFLLDNDILPSSPSAVIAACPGFLLYCPAIDFTHNPQQSTQIAFTIKYWLRRTLLRPFVCLRCKHNTRATLSNYKNQMFRRNTLELLIKSYAFVIKTAFNHRLLRAKLSESIADNTISCYLVSNRSELSDVKANLGLSFFLATRYFHQLYVDLLFEFVNPTHVATFNGRMLPYRVLLNKSLSCNNVPCLVHERGFENSSFVFKINEPAHSRLQLFNYLENNSLNLFHAIPLCRATQWASRFYELRSIGQNIDCQMPSYDLSNLDKIYQTSSPLIVFYMTTPDEVDPSSDEFSLIVNQWDLIPALALKLHLHFVEDNPRIVVRPHPNFYSRFNCPLSNLDSKLDKLRSSINSIPNTFFDSNPAATSSFALFKVSSLSVTFASSSALESEFIGTPSLVPSSHIYKHGCSYHFDCSQLFEHNCQEMIDSLPRSINMLHVRSFDQLVKFAYLWFYLDKFHFDSLTTTSFADITYDNSTERSEDYFLLKSAFASNSNLVECKLSF